jgi:sec-independent protein translocase protein TatC
MPRSKPPVDQVMSFGEHLEALRWHLIRALAGVALSFVLCLVGGQTLTDFLLAPAQHVLTQLGAGEIVVKDFWEGMLAYMHISFVGGLVLASPWVLYQVWGFVAPGLYPHEKRIVYRNLPLLVGLFATGCAFGWCVALPATVRFMTEFNLRMGFHHQITVSSWVAFALIFPIGFGVAFELPLVMSIASRIGLASSAAFRRYRRLAILLAAVVSAVASPTTDPLGMMLMFVPLVLLYESGIWFAWLSERHSSAGSNPREILLLPFAIYLARHRRPYSRS